MKTLQISHGYNAPFLGVSMHYASMLAAQGDVTTLYLSGGESDAVRESTGGDKVLFWELTPKGMKGLKVGLIWKLYKFIRDEKFDVVLCHRYKAIYLALTCQLLGLNFKQVGVIHAFSCFHHITRRWFLSLFKRKLLVLGVSNSVRDDIRQSMPSFPSNKIQTLYNAIDVAEVESRQLDKKQSRVFLGLNDKAFVIGNVGRLHPDKDQTTLIKAFAGFNKKVPGSQLAILGSGRLEETLKALACELGVQKDVLFLGQVADAVNYYKALDLFVLSSDKEPFGLVLLEAMVARVPVVASNCGGAAEVVNGAGCLFEFGDFVELSELMSVIQTEDSGDSLNKAYCKVQQEYSIKSVERVFNKLI